MRIMAICALTALGTLTFLGLACGQAAARAASPSPNSTATPITVVVRDTSSKAGGFSIKDLFIPLGTFLGAVVGAGGAAGVAAISVRAQDRKARDETSDRRTEAEHDRAYQRLASLATLAEEAFQQIIKVSRTGPEAWSTAGADTERTALRLMQVRVLTASRTIPDEIIGRRARDFVARTGDVLLAATRQAAEPHFAEVGTSFDALLLSIAEAQVGPS